MHPQLTPKETPDIDLIQTFIAKNGVTKPTTAQERRYALEGKRARGLLGVTNRERLSLPAQHRDIPQAFRSNVSRLYA